MGSLEDARTVLIIDCASYPSFTSGEAGRDEGRSDRRGGRSRGVVVRGSGPATPPSRAGGDGDGDGDDGGRRQESEVRRHRAVARSSSMDILRSANRCIVDRHDDDEDDSVNNTISSPHNNLDDGCDSPGWCHPFIRRRHYCCPTLQSKCVNSVFLAILSHGCFVVASLAYVKLSYIQLDWLRYVLVYNDVPPSLLNMDDDAVWRSWASANEERYTARTNDFRDVRVEYYDEYASWCVWGASFFVMVGILDYMRYWDTMNVYMILAGLAGVLSGASTDSRTMAIVWECVSVHLYLLESYNLINRDHHHHATGGKGGGASSGEKEDDGDNNRSSSSSSGVVVGFHWHYVFRLGDVMFLVGSVLDVFGSYLGVFGAVGLWVGHVDMVACYLWLGCALTNWIAEFYFLWRQMMTTSASTEDDSVWELHCY